MEMHQIRYFLAVARTLNFTRAAEECHVAQPSLTRAVQKLEDELGGPLFRRERSNTHLSQLGKPPGDASADQLGHGNRRARNQRRCHRILRQLMSIGS